MFPVAAVAVSGAVTAVVLRFGTTSIRRYGAVALLLAVVAVLARARQATRLGIYCAYVALIPALNLVREVADLRVGSAVVTPATAVLAAFLVLGAGHRRAGGPVRARSVLPLACLTLVVLSGLLATGLAASTPDRPTGLAASLWLDGVLLPVLLFAGIVTAAPSRAELRMVAKAIVIAALLSIGLGLLLNAIGGDIARSVNWEDDVLARVGLIRTQATFTFGNPDQFALVGSLATPIAAMLALTSSGRARLGWGGAFLAIGIAEIYTFSRGGIIALVVGLLVAAWFDARARRLVLAIAVATTILAVTIPDVGAVLTARFTQEEVLRSEPVRDRARALGLAVRTVGTTPVGTGAAAFRAIWREAGYSEPALQSPHNLVLGVAVEYGLTAGIAFLVWLAASGHVVAQRLRQRPRDPLLLGLAAGAGAYFVTGMLTGGDLSHLAGEVPLATQTVLFLTAVAAAVCLASVPPEGSEPN